MPQNSKKTLIALAAVAGGLCNGLLGAGGGIILVFAVSRLCGHEFEDKKDIFANTQAAILPITAVSCLIYRVRGLLLFSDISSFALSGIVGGALGALALSKIKSSLLNRLFAIIIIWSGIRMLFF